MQLYSDSLPTVYEMPIEKEGGAANWTPPGSSLGVETALRPLT